MGAPAPPATRALLALGLAFAALELAALWLGPYGLFHDELYYWVNARRPELGYVDHPPLAPWLLAGSTALLGDGRLGIAFVPSLCGAAALVLTGLMAWRLGAGRYGQLLAGLCFAVAPVMLVIFSFFSVNAIEILLWTGACFLLLELCRGGDERLWLALGGVAGLGLLNKHTFALLGFGLALGVVATPLRAQLRTRWPWLGLGVALLLALPNLYWNAAHGWPSLAFYRSRPLVNVPTTFVQALELQMKQTNPGALFVWTAGAGWLLFSKRGRRYRPLGIAFAALLLSILFSGQRRGDRIAGVYPVVMAAGAAFWERWRGRYARGLRVALPVLVLAVGVVALPVALPLLPPKTTAEYLAAIDEEIEIEAHDVGNAVPLYLMGRLDWERVAEAVASAAEALPAEQRERAVVLAPHWVFAAVIEYYGRGRDLPPVVAPHNAYWFWRGDAAGRDVALGVAIESGVLAPYFAETRRVGVYRCEHCTTWRTDLPLVLATGPVRPLTELLEEWRHFGITPAPALRPVAEAERASRGRSR